jgi:homeobox protein Unc-4
VRSEWSCLQLKFLLNLIAFQFFSPFFKNRARRRKRLAKAIERQAKKLRAKGISVDLEALKADYVAQHRGQFLNSSDSEDNDDPIDVVGGTEESDDCGSLQRLDYLNDNNKNESGSLDFKGTSKTNIFSIERILCGDS